MLYESVVCVLVILAIRPHLVPVSFVTPTKVPIGNAVICGFSILYEGFLCFGRYKRRWSGAILYFLCAEFGLLSFLIFERIHLSESLLNDARFGVLGYELRYRTHINASDVGFAIVLFNVDKSKSDDDVNGIYFSVFDFPIRLKYSSIRKSGHLIGFCSTLASTDRKYSALFRSSGHNIVGDRSGLSVVGVVIFWRAIIVAVSITDRLTSDICLAI